MISLVWQLDPSSPVTTATGTSTPAETNAVYGTDKFFSSGKQVTTKGDWLLVSGEENLRRAILRRIITTPGSYKSKPNYGVGMATYVKKPISRAVLDELTNRLRSQVSQDRRVDKVIDAQVTPTTWDGQPGIHVLLTVQAYGRIQRPMGFTFKRA